MRHVPEILDWKRDFKKILLSIQEKYSTQDSNAFENLLLQYELIFSKKFSCQYIPSKATKDLMAKLHGTQLNFRQHLLDTLAQTNTSLDPNDNTSPEQLWQNYVHKVLEARTPYQKIYCERASACITWKDVCE